MRDGLIKHLLVTSERLGTEPNVWLELGEGEYLIVDHGMNFRRQLLVG